MLLKILSSLQRRHKSGKMLHNLLQNIALRLALCLGICCAVLVLSTQYGEAWPTHPYKDSVIVEETSLYGPTNRNFPGIVTLELPTESRNFRLVVNPRNLAHRTVSTDARVFNFSTRYYTLLTRHPALPTEKVQLNSSTVKTRQSVLSVAQITLDAYAAPCENLELLEKLTSLDVHINPHNDTCSSNAHYTRTGDQGGVGVIEFCSNGVEVARIFDVVSHEVGHAILDTLNPDLYGYSGNHPVSAFHEAFADLTTLFTSIHLATRIEPKNSLNGVIAGLIEGEPEICLAPGLRGADTCLLRENEDSPCECHANSANFRHFFLDALNTAVGDNPRESATIAQHFQELLICTAINTDPTKAISLYNFGQNFDRQALEVNSPFHTIIADALTRHAARLRLCRNGR